MHVCAISSKRLAASHKIALIPTSRVTMKMFLRNLTGTTKVWSRVASLVTTLPDYSNLVVISCIVLKNSYVVNCSCAVLLRTQARAVVNFGVRMFGGIETCF